MPQRPRDKQPWYYRNPGRLELAGWIVVVIFMFLMVILMTPAKPAGVCLSKHEARELWPRRHIYWYSNHCWSNRRGPPRGIKLEPVHQDPVKQSMAQAPEPPPPIALPAPLSFLERWYEFPSVFVFFRQRMLP